ncbi:hypothetical protein [Streptomyces sp. NPDC058228]|uniref:hypothetical protein n=1 Tax=Streptomyces sp. NPDC058228 TaxID=3346390 RepID=UPI0036E5AD3D
MDAPEHQVNLRMARDPISPETTWWDLGRMDGKCVRIDPGTWAVTVPPVTPGQAPLWRRTRLTGEVPLPVLSPAGWQPALERLRELLPVTDATWPLAVASLLAGLLPDVPRPLTYLTGEQGTGKSTSARMLLRVIEGPAADLRSMPRDEDDLSVVAAAGWTLALDNASGIPPWLSDSLCRIVTGATSAKRELFSDDDVALITYMRPTILTGIDVGALRGDLAERMLRLELAPIPADERRTERDLWATYDELLPTVLGGLVELASLVWRELPGARKGLTTRARMADFCELLWALDRVTGWNSLKTYLGDQDMLVDDVLDADPVATTILEWAQAQQRNNPGTPWTWHGSSDALLTALTDFRGFGRTGDRWPITGQVLVSRLRRASPVLRKRGLEWDKWRTKTARGVDLWHTPTGAVPEQTPPVEHPTFA